MSVFSGDILDVTDHIVQTFTIKGLSAKILAHLETMIATLDRQTTNQSNQSFVFKRIRGSLEHSIKVCSTRQNFIALFGAQYLYSAFMNG